MFGGEAEDSSRVLQRRRQCELVLLDRPCLLSLAGEVPAWLGELGPVIDHRRKRNSKGRESSSSYDSVLVFSVGQYMLIYMGKPYFSLGLRDETNGRTFGLKGICLENPTVRRGKSHS